jgi:hypothetical protein
MKLNKLVVLSLAVVPLVFACKDRTNNPRTTGSRESNYPGTATGRESNPTTGVMPSERNPSANVNKETSNEVANAKINSKGSLTFTGTAKVHDVTAAGGSVTLNLTGSSPGVYMVRIFETSDCSQVPMLDTTSGKIATGDQASGTKPDIIAEAGEITVGSDGTGYVDGTLTNVKSGSSTVKSFDNKVVALFAKKPEPASTKVSGTTTAKGPEACGVLSTALADQTAG